MEAEMETAAAEPVPAILPIMEYLLKFLRSDPEGVEQFVFVGDASEMLRRGLDALFDLPQDPLPTLDELVRFACALQLELYSPSAAGLVRAGLTSDPRVFAALGGCKDREESEASALFFGQNAVKKAPMFGVAAAEGTIKASSFIDPCPRPRGKPSQRGAR